MTRKLFWMIFVAPVLGATALSAGAEQAGDSLFRHAENALQDEARVLHRDFTSPERWRDWTLDRANGEDADIQAWMSSRWKETPGRLADSLAGSAASWVGAGLRESEWVETLDFGFQLPLEGRTGWMNLNAIGPLSRGEDSVLGWQLPLSFGSADDDGETEMVGNVGLFYRRALGDWGLAGVNLFGDYQDEGADGDFWRWSVGAEYRTSWADVFVNRYIPSSPAQRTLLSGGTQERIAYSAGGYDAEVRFHAPRSRWLEGFAEYSLWEGEYGDADDSGFRYGFRLLPRTGSLADGFRFEADYDDTLDGGLGARFSYDWTLGQTPRRTGYAAFDPRAHLFASVERRHEQNIRTRIRTLQGDHVLGVGRSDSDRDCKSDPASWSDEVDSAVNMSLTAAAAAGDVQGVCDALDGINNDVAANPNYPGSENAEWALHFAATLNTDEGLKIVSLLVTAGADVTAQGRNRNHPLHHAAEHGAYRTAGFLLEKGAPVNAWAYEDDNSRYGGDFPQPLDYVAHAKYGTEEGERTAEILLAHGGECQSQDSHDWCRPDALPVPLSDVTDATFYASADYTGVAATVAALYSEAGTINFTVSLTLARSQHSNLFGFDESSRRLTIRDSLSAGGYTVRINALAKQGSLRAVALSLTLLVSVLSEVESLSVSASPYAEGDFLTLTLNSRLPEELRLNFRRTERAALSVRESGGVAWGDGALATLGEGYGIRAEATAEWLAGTLSFSLTVDADCSPEALYGADANLEEDEMVPSFVAHARSGNVNEVCWHIGNSPDIVNERDNSGKTALNEAVEGAWAVAIGVNSGDGRHGEVVKLLLNSHADPNLTVAEERGELYTALDRANFRSRDNGRYTPDELTAITAAMRDIAKLLRDAGGICSRSGDYCGLFWTWPSDASVTVSHNWSGALLTVAFSALTEDERSYRVPNESRLTVEEANFNSVDKTGEIVVSVASADAPLLGGEELTANIVAWSEMQTLSATLTVSVAYGNLSGLSAADSVYTVAWDYREDLLTVTSAMVEANLSYDWPSGAKATLAPLSPVAAAWRWVGDAEYGGAYQATVLVTISHENYHTLVTKSTISIYAVAQPDGKVLTVSPYAMGGFLTLSHSELSGLSFKKADGSAESLILDAGGAVEWTSDARVGAGFYNLTARATAEGLLGTLHFSASVWADCKPGVPGNPDADLSDFKQAVESNNEVAVCGHVINGEEVNAIIPGSEYDEHPLHVAAGENATGVAALLAELGAEKDALDGDGYTPLHWAADETTNGGAEVAVLLLILGSNPNVQNEFEEETPLHLAAEAGKIKVVSALLSDAETDLNVKNENGKTPLYLAVEAGEIGVVSALLADDRTDLNATSESGKTPLYLAVEEENTEMVSALLADDRVQVNHKNSNGDSALDLAAKEQSRDLAPKLREKGGVCFNGEHSRRSIGFCGLYLWPRSAGASVTFEETTAIYTLTVRSSDEVDFAPIENSGFSLSVSEVSNARRALAVVHATAPDLDDAGELLVAMSSGAQTLTMALNVTVGRKPPYRTSPVTLTLTAAVDYEGNVRFLASADKDESLSYHSGLEGGLFTLVALPPRAAMLSLVSPLPTGGAMATVEVNLNRHGYVPSLATVFVKISALGPYSDDFEILRTATSVGYRFSIPGFPNARFEEVGDNGGFYGVSENDGRITLNMNATLLVGMSHTIVVAGKDPGFLGEVPLALTLSVSFCLRDGPAGLSLLQAAQGGDADMVCRLVRRGANVEVIDSINKWTPLHWAAHYGHLEVAQYLVSLAGANAEARHNLSQRRTPLHVAAFWDRLEVVKYLTPLVNAELGDNAGRRPLHLAAYNGNLKVVKYLLNHVDANAVDQSEGWTALHYAVHFDHSKMVEYLWNHPDVDTEVMDYYGQTPSVLSGGAYPDPNWE